MIRVENLTCRKGDRVLFSKLSFSVDPGNWLHVRGENGSGKTSLLRMIAGLGPCDEGGIFWRGQPLAGALDAFHQELLFLGHLPALKDDLTALENIEFTAAIEGHALNEPDALRALRHWGLQGRESLPVRVLSAGQKRRVMLTRLITRPARLWVLDEPFTALDARAIQLLNELLQTHLQTGGAAILTSHQDIGMPDGRVVLL